MFVIADDDEDEEVDDEVEDLRETRGNVWF